MLCENDRVHSKSPLPDRDSRIAYCNYTPPGSGTKIHACSCLRQCGTTSPIKTAFTPMLKIACHQLENKTGPRNSCPGQMGIGWQFGATAAQSLLSHLDRARSDHLRFVCVPALQFLHNGVACNVALHPDDGLVQVRIKGLADCLDGYNILLFQHIP